jgi:hypothetical protein
VTVRAWLRARQPAAPPRLAARVESALGDRCELPNTQAADACLDASVDLLRELLSRESAGRESALDLLAADALVTYAFEAAAQDPQTLATRADDAMRRLSAAVQ